jgi:hypothetical protein
MKDKELFDLMRAVKIDKAPCEGCHFYFECYQNETACEIFRLYIIGIKSALDSMNKRKPTKEIFNDIFKNGRLRVA